jgi:hypothetical protein
MPRKTVNAMPNNPIEKFEKGIDMELTNHLVNWLQTRYPSYQKIQKGFGTSIYLSAIAALIIYTHQRGIYANDRGTPQTKIAEYIGMNRNTLRRFITKLKLKSLLSKKVW